MIEEYINKQFTEVKRCVYVASNDEMNSFIEFILSNGWHVDYAKSYPRVHKDLSGYYQGTAHRTRYTNANGQAVNLHTSHSGDFLHLILGDIDVYNSQSSKYRQ